MLTSTEQDLKGKISKKIRLGWTSLADASVFSRTFVSLLSNDKSMGAVAALPNFEFLTDRVTKDQWSWSVISRQPWLSSQQTFEHFGKENLTDLSIFLGCPRWQRIPAKFAINFHLFQVFQSFVSFSLGTFDANDMCHFIWRQTLSYLWGNQRKVDLKQLLKISRFAEFADNQHF